MIKEIDEGAENKQEEQDDHRHQKEMKRFVEKRTKCQRCGYEYQGDTCTELDEDRINHVKEKHPESRLFKIGDTP